MSHVNGVHRVILPKSRDPPTLKYFGVFIYVHAIAMMLVEPIKYEDRVEIDR